MYSRVYVFLLCEKLKTGTNEFCVGLVVVLNIDITVSFYIELKIALLILFQNQRLNENRMESTPRPLACTGLSWNERCVTQ